MGVQIISRDGEPEYAVLPWDDYQALLKAAGHSQPAIEPEPPRAAEVGTDQLPALDELAALRQAKGLAAEALARSVGISPHYLGMIETGERVPDRAILRSLAWELGVPGWRDAS